MPTLETRHLHPPHAGEAPFHSLYRHGVARLAVGTPAVDVASPASNVAATIEVARQAAGELAVFGVFPELGLSAYSNEDLFQQDALLDIALSDYAMEAVYQHHRGWENNEGGYGEVIFDCEAGTVRIEHFDYFVESEYTETEL